MTDFLETTVDKFIFRVATDRLYTSEGLWAQRNGDTVRLGVSDYFQQHNGDMAFVNLPPVGSELKYGEEIASVETIKVNISLPCPVSGTLVKINEVLFAKPELVNEDPYERGWLCDVKLTRWSEEQQNLLTPDDYFILMKKQAEEEVNKNA